MAPVLSMLLACMIVAQDFGVSEAGVLKEFTFNRGAHLRMFWLRHTYGELVVARSYEVVARLYMLHHTLFADKSGVYIDAWYVFLFSSLDITSWAWRCAALTILYTVLGVATIFETRQPAGYLSMLLVRYHLLFVVDLLFNCWK